MVRPATGMGYMQGDVALEHRTAAFLSGLRGNYPEALTFRRLRN